MMTENDRETFDPCWFCGLHVDMGCMCDEFDFVAYHVECGNKITMDQSKCAVCYGEGLENNGCNWPKSKESIPC